MKNRFSKLFTVLTVVLLLLLVNTIGSQYFFRLDLTAEKRYSLHPETKNLLQGLKEDVFIRVYLDGDDLPSGFLRMRRSIRELLDEMEEYSNGKFDFTFVNPTESSDKAVRFAMYKQLHQQGLVPIEASEESSQGKTQQVMLFPGAIVGYGSKQQGVNLLKNDSRFKLDGPENINSSIEALEYEISNAVRKLSVKVKPKIAFLEGHGELPEHEVVDITRTLSEYYNVQRGAVGGKVGMLDPFEAIIVAQPTRPFNKADKYVLDQYLMQGGKILWLLDGVRHQVDSTSQADVIALGNDLNLTDMLFRYGVRVNPDLVQDLQSSYIGLTRTAKNGRPRIQRYRWPFFPILVTRNSNVINKYIAPIRTEYISTVDTVGGNPKVDKQIILETSRFSRIKAVPIHLRLQDAMIPIKENEFKGTPKSVAVLLTGSFESAFTNRPVANYTNNVENFRKTSIPTKMCIVGSGSIIRNELSAKGEIIPLGFDRHSKKLFKGNKEFLLNAVNYLCDDRGMMEIRNREIKLRLMDKARVIEERTAWQLINVLVPIVLVIVLGVIWVQIRRRRFARK